MTERFEFTSDNSAGICPEAIAELEKANIGEAASYGDDEWTGRLCQRVREIFETNCEVFLVFNGTAANALALAQLCQSFHSIICHEHAHIENDECGACEFFTRGSKLIPTRGAHGKLDLGEVDIALARQHELHSHKPRVLSITQATELGTLYQIDEIGKIAAFAKERGLLMHMDGARFANAVTGLNCAPKEMTWQIGVDVLCFGGTKNGLAAGELVIFFDKQRSAEFEYRAKQAGQLASKMRLLSAPWLALLKDGVWLKNAERANAAAKKMGDALLRAGVQIVFPIEANAVFVQLDAPTIAKLNKRGWQFFKYIEPDIYRLMCSWAVRDVTIAELAGDFKMARSCVEVAA